MPTAEIGWSRNTWNSGEWNLDPDALATVTGEQLESSVFIGPVPGMA